MFMIFKERECRFIIRILQKIL